MLELETLRGSWEKVFEGYKSELADIETYYPEKITLKLDYENLLAKDLQLAEELFARPNTVIYSGEQVLRDKIGNEVRLRIINLPPEVARIDIRKLRAEHLGKFISVEGLVKKATEVRPKLRKALFQCSRCGAVVEVEQEEFAFKEPLECDKEQGGCGRATTSTSFKLLSDPSKLPIGEERDLSEFVNSQKIEIQESPEGLRGGEQPQRLVGYAEDDLAGIVSPGDRIVINGILQSRQRKQRGIKSTVFDIFLNINSIELKELEFEEVIISKEEERKIKKFARKDGLAQKIIASIAPSIYGIETEKEALAMQLFSGLTKTMPDGTQIRGDIHILLVGDPGTAKSQVLRYISQLAPRGIYAAGKSTSAAGLTASAVRDEFGEGRWTLEAGALVLADRGIACVDEIDKMDSKDRSAMHEALEQQQVSVAKAGITATLHSRCALLSAANPKYGRFEDVAPVADQIELAPTLLSRFDLIFLITDKPDTKKDSAMADHLLRMHQAGEHSLQEGREEPLTIVRPEIPPEFLRKYIAYARRNVSPVLTKEAIEKLKEYYMNLRKQGNAEEMSVPVSPRQLEAFIRLAEASARMRLSKSVDLEDAKRAIRIMDYCLRRVALDYETGRFDIDRIATDTPHTQRERIRHIREIIKELSEKDSAGALRKEVIGKATDLGISKDRVEQTLSVMKRKGEIYEPRTNRYKLT